MPARTQMHHTDSVNLMFTGPADKAMAAVQAMLALGFVRESEGSESIPWREAETFADLTFPGSYLAGCRFREGLTQAQLSEQSGIPRRHISEMENGKRPIGKSNAAKLAKALHVDARMLLTV